MYLDLNQWMAENVHQQLELRALNYIYVSERLAFLLQEIVCIV